MRFAAPWDRALRTSTGALLAVVAVAAAVVLLVASRLGGALGAALGGFTFASH